MAASFVCVCSAAPPASPSCLELVRRACEEGDDAAFEQLLERLLETRIAPIVRRCCRHHPQEWEDIVQAILMRVFAGMCTFEGRAPFCAWVGVVAANTAINYRRRMERHVPPLPLDGDFPAPGQPSSPSSECKECIKGVIERAPEKERMVWHLYYSSRTPTTQDQIGKKVELTRERVNQLLRKLKQKIVESCKNECGQHTGLPREEGRK